MVDRPTIALAATAAAGTQVPGASVERGEAGALARTGSNAIDMGTIGLGLIPGGATVTRANRRRPKPA